MESSIHHSIQKMNNDWVEVISKLLKYGARQFGTQYSKGARFWHVVMGLNEKL